MGEEAEMGHGLIRGMAENEGEDRAEEERHRHSDPAAERRVLPHRDDAAERCERVEDAPRGLGRPLVRKSGDEVGDRKGSRDRDQRVENRVVEARIGQIEGGDGGAESEAPEA